MKAELFIKNGLVWRDETRSFEPEDIGVSGGKIAFYVRRGEAGADPGGTVQADQVGPVQADQVIDAAGCYVLPGMIDFHCHIREPGVEAKEDYESGTKAAAHGGVTTVAVMPNNLTRGICSPEDFELAISRGEQGAVIDFAPVPSPLAFHEGSLPELCGRGASFFKLMELKNNKVPLAENFRCGDTWELDQCFAAAAETGKYVAIHPMDMDWYLGNVNAVKNDGGPQDLEHVLCRLYGEEEMTSAAYQLAYFFRKNKCRWWALHTWHKAYIDLIRMIKADGHTEVLASCEILPSSIRNFDVLYHRETGERIRLGHAAMPDWDYVWEAVRDGTIDLLGSDHSPHLKEHYKEKEPFSSAQGVPGEDYYGSLLLDAVNRGKLTLERLVEVTSEKGARLLGWKEKGTNAVGTDADFTICDLGRRWTVDDSFPIYSKPGLDPLYGQELLGKVTHTIVRGRVVMAEDRILAEPGFGQFVRPAED